MKRKISDFYKFKVSGVYNRCVFHVVARRIILDMTRGINDEAVDAVIARFNDLYETNYNAESLAEVLEKMGPDRAEIVLGFALGACRRNQSIDILHLKDIVRGLGYKLAYFGEDFAKYNDTTGTGNMNYSDFLSEANKSDLEKAETIIIFRSGSQSNVGHYNLMLPKSYPIEESEVRLYQDLCEKKTYDFEYAKFLGEELFKNFDTDTVNAIKNSGKLKQLEPLKNRSEEDLGEEEVMEKESEFELAKRQALTLFKSFYNSKLRNLISDYHQHFDEKHTKIEYLKVTCVNDEVIKKSPQIREQISGLIDTLIMLVNLEKEKIGKASERASSDFTSSEKITRESIESSNQNVRESMNAYLVNFTNSQQKSPVKAVSSEKSIFEVTSGIERAIPEESIKKDLTTINKKPDFGSHPFFAENSVDEIVQHNEPMFADYQSRNTGENSNSTTSEENLDVGYLDDGLQNEKKCPFPLNCFDPFR